MNDVGFFLGIALTIIGFVSMTLIAWAEHKRAIYSEDMLREFVTELHNLREAKRLFLKVFPDCFVCPNCGPFAKVDEDTCCATCGRDTEIMNSETALANATKDGGM